MILIIMVFGFNVLLRNDLYSVMAFITVSMLAVGYEKYKKDVIEVKQDLAPLYLDVRTLKSEFSEVKLLAEDAKKQLNLINLKSGFRTLGKHD